MHNLNNSSPSQPSRFLTDLIVFVPERLQLLLAAQIPEVQPHAVRVNLADVEPHRGRDLGQVGPLVVAVEAGLGRLQEGGLARIVQPKDQHKEFVLLPGLRIRIDFDADPDPGFFDDQKLKKNIKAKITINVPLFKKLRDIIFFLRDNNFLSRFEGPF